MKFHHTLIIAVSVLAVACGRAEQSATPTIGYVEGILSNETCYEATLLRSYSGKSTEGAIAVVGDSILCSRYSSMLLESDIFDNVDGRRIPDGLKDFSGEMIASYNDAANAGFDGYAARGNQMTLREIAVRDFIMAADTACSIAAFDTLKMMAQPRAKIVVMASPFMAECGAFDIDTLMKRTGADINLIYPVLDARKAALQHSKVARVGVLTDSTTAKSGVYARVLGSIADEKCIASLDEMFACQDSTSTMDVLAEYLHKCIDAGANKPLSTIIVDDSRLSVSEAKASLEAIYAEHTEDNMMYRSLLEKDVQVISLTELVIEECFKTLRTRNLFTHKISRPMFRSYMTVPVKGLEESCYSTDRSFNEQYRYTRKSAADYTVVNIEHTKKHVSDKRN